MPACTPEGKSPVSGLNTCTFDCLQLRSSGKASRLTGNITPYTCQVALSQKSFAIGTQQVSGQLDWSSTDDVSIARQAVLRYVFMMLGLHNLACCVECYCLVSAATPGNHMGVVC